MKRKIWSAIALSLVFCFTACANVQAAGENAAVQAANSSVRLSAGFDDISPDAWYAAAVDYCRDNGIMGGTADTLFSPEDTMSRAMLAAALWRLDGSPDAAAQIAFADVQEDAWYAGAVRWAVYSGVISGYNDAAFGSEAPVTREQIAAMLYRYAQQKGSVPGVSGSLSFADNELISEWARDAVLWAAEQGIVSGKAGGVFDPGAAASRAEVAVMLYRYAGAAGADTDASGAADTGGGEPAANEDGTLAVEITIGGGVFAARFFDNASAQLLAEQMPLTLDMNDYAGQEKVLGLALDFPHADTVRPDTIRAGELYLWSGNQLVLFYTTFSNSYGGYVPIGRIDDVSGLTDALGSGSVSITFSLKRQ